MHAGATPTVPRRFPRQWGACLCRMSLAAYVLIAAGAAVPWSLHQAFIGAVVARLLTGAPLLAVIVSIVVALTVGVPLDLVLTKRRGVPRGTDERAAGGRDPGLSEPDERVD